MFICSSLSDHHPKIKGQSHGRDKLLLSRKHTYLDKYGNCFQENTSGTLVQTHKTVQVAIQPYPRPAKHPAISVVTSTQVTHVHISIYSVLRWLYLIHKHVEGGANVQPKAKASVGGGVAMFPSFLAFPLRVFPKYRSVFCIRSKWKTKEHTCICLAFTIRTAGQINQKTLEQAT